MTEQQDHFYGNLLVQASLAGPLRQPGRLVRDRPADRYGFPFSERHLQCVWFDPALRPAVLRTLSGEIVTVRNPGRWNLEPGPDFLDAILTVAPGSRTISGDVEVHIHPADWHRHGHADDPRYSGVVAHVSFFPDTMAVAPHVLRISLEDPLLSNPLFSFESIDTTAYPWPLPHLDTPCSRFLGNCDRSATEHLLESAGLERIRQKVERISSRLLRMDAEQVFYEEVMSSLGYKNNRSQFRRLAQLVQVDELALISDGNSTNAYALLLGASGLLPVRMSTRWDSDTRNFIRTLWDFWWKHAARYSHLVMQRNVWQLAATRPQNHPLRRIAAAAALFCSRGKLLADLDELTSDNPAEWTGQAIDRLKESATLAYWRNRLSLQTPPSTTPIALLGTERASAIMSNVVLPFMAARGMRAANVETVLRSLPPEHHNILVSSAAKNILGPDHNSAMYRYAIRQHGLIQIFSDFCLNSPLSCRNCALPGLLSDHLTDTRSPVSGS